MGAYGMNPLLIFDDMPVVKLKMKAIASKKYGNSSRRPTAWRWQREAVLKKRLNHQWHYFASSEQHLVGRGLWMEQTPHVKTVLQILFTLFVQITGRKIRPSSERFLVSWDKAMCDFLLNNEHSRCVKLYKILYSTIQEKYNEIEQLFYNQIWYETLYF